MSAIDSVAFPTSDYTRIPTGRFKIVPRKWYQLLLGFS
jgi:hypothetical protein